MVVGDVRLFGGYSELYQARKSEDKVGEDGSSLSWGW